MNLANISHVNVGTVDVFNATIVALTIAAAVWGFFKNLHVFTKKPKHPAPPPGYELFCTVRDILVELRTETRADFALLALFHNGASYTVNNMSMQRFSVPLESLKTGQSSVAELYDSKLISHYLGGLSKILECDRSATIHLSTVGEGLYKASMIASHVKRHVASRLTWNNSVVGFVLLGYEADDGENKCCFNALVDQDIEPSEKTRQFHLRTCSNDCPDCRLNEVFIPRLELILNDEHAGIEEWTKYKELCRVGSDKENERTN